MANIKVKKSEIGELGNHEGKRYVHLHVEGKSYLIDKKHPNNPLADGATNIGGVYKVEKYEPESISGSVITCESARGEEVTDTSQLVKVVEFLNGPKFS